MLQTLEPVTAWWMQDAQFDEDVVPALNMFVPQPHGEVDEQEELALVADLFAPPVPDDPWSEFGEDDMATWDANAPPPPPEPRRRVPQFPWGLAAAFAQGEEWALMAPGDGEPYDGLGVGHNIDGGVGFVEGHEAQNGAFEEEAFTVAAIFAPPPRDEPFGELADVVDAAQVPSGIMQPPPPPEPRRRFPRILIGSHMEGLVAV